MPKMPFLPLPVALPLGRWRRQIIGLVLICSVALAPSPAKAAESSKTPIALDSVKGRFLEQQKRARRVEQGLQEQKERVAQTRKQESGVLAELEAADTRLNEQRQKLTELNRKLEEQRDTLSRHERLVNVAAAEKSGAQRQIEKRLAAYYRLGADGLLQIIFSTDSIGDLLTLDDNFQALVRHDNRLLAQYRKKIGSLMQAQASVTAEADRLRELRDALHRQEEALSQARAEKATLLNRIKTEKKLYQAAVEELEGAGEKLTATLFDLEGQIRRNAERRSQPPVPAAPAASAPPVAPAVPKGSAASVTPQKKVGLAASFPDMKGRLDPPVRGTVVTGFGSSKDDKFGITTVQNGIDIRTDPGSAVRAVHEGKVIYAGILRGYGNLVILDHGEQFYSVMSRIGQIFKKEGEPVAAGDIVGIMEDNLALLGEGLHFEIRQGAKPEDPMAWLDKAKLRIEAGQAAN